MPIIPTLGILAQRWRLLFRPIVADPNKVTTLVKAMCVLHNFLLHTQDQDYCPPGFADSLSSSGEVADGFWRANGQSASSLEGLDITSRSLSTAGVEIRERLRAYFIDQGSVDWQYQHINRR